MADRSKIEWTDASWNPIRARVIAIQNDGSGKQRIGWHCEHVSEGCRNCYAEGFNRRLGTGRDFKPGELYREEKKGFNNGEVKIFLDDQMLTQPLRWKKPRRIFVCSMTDAFADFVTDEMLDKMFAVMALAPQHTFQVLTKRAKRMRNYFEPTGCVNCGDGQLDGNCCEEPWVLKDGEGAAFRDALIEGAAQKIFSQLHPGMGEPSEWLAVHMPLPNVWLGVSAERQPEADERIPELLATPAAVRFVSLEPLLGHISLYALNLATPTPSDALRGVQCVPDDSTEGFHNEPIAKLDWVIVGGESGREARSMHPDWPRSLRDWCRATDVAFFFKQWGEWAPSTPEEARGNPHSGWMASAAHPHVAKASELYPEAGAKFIARVGKAAAGRLLDGVEHNEFPRVPA